MSESLNGNMGIRVAVDTSAMEWTASPSGTVWRKRVHLVGPTESGQVTSIVRYEAGAKFPEHGHPDGEEILVLEGVFSDQAGDWKAGSYLMNPEGFHHAPWSEPGCVIFVKLRQYPGRRRHVTIDVDEAEWADDPRGCSVKRLYAENGHDESIELLRLDAGSRLEAQRFPGGAELFVVEGAVREHGHESDEADEPAALETYGWLRVPAGATLRLASDAGAVVYLKSNHLPGLLSTS